MDSKPDVVMVFESNDRFTIGLAKACLEDSGIPFVMRGDETEAHLALAPIMFPSCEFLVTRDREAEARGALDSLEFPQQNETS